MADNPTKIYTTRDNTDDAPKRVATRSKFARPTKPQFNPPTMTRTMAIQSITFNFIIFLLFFPHFCADKNNIKG